MSASDGIGAKWRTLGSCELLQAMPWLRVTKDSVKLPSGRVIDDFYRVELPDFASVLACVADGRVLLVRGYKHGIGSETLMPPAGLIEQDETPLQAAKRELLEETGYASDEWSEFGSFVVDANRQCGRMHLFTASNASQIAMPPPDDAEELQTVLMSREDVIQALRKGAMKSLAGAAAAAVGLLLWEPA